MCPNVPLSQMFPFEIRADKTMVDPFHLQPTGPSKKKSEKVFVSQDSFMLQCNV